MKTTIFLVFLWLTSFVFPALPHPVDSVFTNKARHEVEIGYGTPSFMLLIGDAFADNNVIFPVNINVQYMYNVSKHFGIGAGLAYSSYYEEYYSHIHTENYLGKGEKYGESDYFHLFTVGLTGRAYWFYKKHFAMYSKYGLTLSACTEDDFSTIIFWPFNFSLIGFEGGGKRWRAYCEPLSLISMWPAVQAGVKYLF